jgi:transcriptional regulator with XRE-family HTH domain
MTTRFTTYSDELRRKYGRLTFGRVMIAWRKCEEMTQAEFARMIGLSSANVCDIEQGRRIPSPSRARKIARKLGLPDKVLVAIALEDVLEREGMKFQVRLVDDVA